MTSSTVPSKFSNGPSLILTRSPRSTSIRTLRGSSVLARLLAEHLVDLGLGHLGRRAVGPDEVADAGGLADDEPGLLVQLHLDHDVAGIGLPLDDPLLVVADLGDLLGRHHDPAEEALKALDLDPPLQGVADRVLARALDLQDVPDQLRRRLVVVVVGGAAPAAAAARLRRPPRPARLRPRRRLGLGSGSAARARPAAAGGRQGPPSGVCSSTSNGGRTRPRRRGRRGVRRARGPVGGRTGSGSRRSDDSCERHAVEGGQRLDRNDRDAVDGSTAEAIGPSRRDRPEPVREAPARSGSAGARAEGAAAAELQDAEQLEQVRPEPVDAEEEDGHQEDGRRGRPSSPGRGRRGWSTRPCSSRLRWRSGTRRTAGYCDEPEDEPAEDQRRRAPGRRTGSAGVASSSVS